MSTDLPRRLLFYVVFFGLLAVLLFGLGPFFAPMLFAVLLAFIFYPLVDRLTGRGFGRGFSCALVTLLTLCLLGALLLLLVPLLAGEAENLKEKLPEIGRALKEWLVDLPLYDTYSRRIRDFTSRDILEKIPSSLQGMVKSAFQSADDLFKFLVRFFSFFIFPLFMYYFLSKAPEIRAFLLLATPPRWRRSMRDFFDFVNHTFGLYFRGQMLVGLILSALYVAGFLVVGFPSPFLVGVVSGLLNIVPYFGTGFGMVLALLILLSQFSMTLLLKTLAVFVAVQTLEAYAVTPRVVGRSVNVPFFHAFTAIVIGGNVAGFWGMILAMPVTAIIRYLLEKTQPR